MGERKFVQMVLDVHMTKMATTPIYGKNPLKISRTRRQMNLGFGGSAVAQW